MNSRVWVVQSNMRRLDDGSWVPKFDLSEAASYGSLEFIFGQGNMAMMPALAWQAVEDRLRDFNIVDDFLLPVGDTALIGLVFRAIEREFGKRGVQVLHWDGAAKRYDVVVV